MPRCAPSLLLLPALAVLAAGPTLARELPEPAPVLQASVQSVGARASEQNCPSWGEFESSEVDGVEVRTRWCESHDQESLILQVEWRGVGARPASFSYRGFMLPAGDRRCPSEDRAREGDGVSRQLFGRLSLTPGDRRSAAAMHVPSQLRRGRRLRICIFGTGPSGRTH